MKMEQELKEKLEAIIFKNEAFPKCGCLTFMYEAYLLDRDKWISVDEWPKKSGRYLVLDEDEDVFIDILEKSNNAKDCCYTHWQPLPKKPNQ